MPPQNTIPCRLIRSASRQIFLARFQELSPESQQAAMENVMAHIQAHASRQASMYGGLTAVDLHSPTPVAAQVDALPFPAALQFAASSLRARLFQERFRPSEARVSSGVTTYPSALASSQARAFSSTSTPTLALRIHSVKCLDETGEEWRGGELGSDDIYLAGTIVDESGDTDKVPPFKVGDFDDGDIKRYAPPRVFTTFDLREGTDWPKSYFVTLVLTEKDQGGLADYLNRLIERSESG